MRKVLCLPHRAYDYNCMLSGLEDLIEQKIGIRLPEYAMFLGSFIGFRYEEHSQRTLARRVEVGNGIGRGQYEFLSGILGFRWHISEGKVFGTAWEEMRGLVDQGKPVIMGELDMFHLPYLKKFYHRIHVPIHYITLVGYDDDCGTALVQDCGRTETMEIPVSELKKALSIPVDEPSKPNTFFWFDLDEHRDSSLTPQTVINQILRRRAAVFLNPPSDNQGINALRKLIVDFPEWHQKLTPRQYNESLRHMVTFTCSTVPMPPQRLVFFPIDNQFSKHQAARDRFALLLREVGAGSASETCLRAAELFEQSGCLFQEITDLATDYLASLIKTKRHRQGLEFIPQRFQRVAEIETQAFSLLAGI